MDKITLVIEWEWQPWAAWDTIRKWTDKRYPSLIPTTSGVYELRRVVSDGVDSEERWLIGKSDNLDRRVRNELVKGDDTLYPQRSRILAAVQGDTSLLEVRWAEAILYTELESQLHSQYQARFGSFPDFVQRK
jgi:hypothetical protein